MSYDQEQEVTSPPFQGDEKENLPNFKLPTSGGSH